MLSEGPQFIKNLDIVFCLDITGSMGSYLRKATTTIKKIMDDVSARSEVRHIKRRFAFVGYRDHPPEDSSFVTRVKDFCSYSELKAFIDRQNADGGGDYPEAVLDGLRDSITKISWKDNDKFSTLRYIVHICDAPPHGKEFGGCGDGFPLGCPVGITLADVGKLFFVNNIRYRLYLCS